MTPPRLQSPLPAEVIDALSRGMAKAMVNTVAEVGGQTSDVLTVLTAMTARVIAAALPEHADAESLALVNQQAGAFLAFRRKSEREAIAGLQ